MWTIIIASIVILAGLFGYGIYMMFRFAEKMDHSNAVEVELPQYFSEEKPCGAIMPSIHIYPCDMSGDAYHCGDCELGI